MNPLPPLAIPTEPIGPGRFSITWFHSSVCSRHGRPAVTQFDWTIDRSELNSMSRWLMQPSTLFTRQGRTDWDLQHPSIAANWPLCDVCSRRRTLIICAAIALGLAGLFTLAAATMLNQGTTPVLLFVGALILFIAAGVTTAESGIGKITHTAPSNDLDAVVVLNPHPAFYTQARAMINLPERDERS
ncbi:hypothetical protein CCUG60885_02744 [Mycobacteroides salmoniphilum]|uniref:Uncharacterized protein n=2 Tax=Mycobacteroides salmoniphilum TaxID=404941 RepID=A0A4R8SI66_9MYCO|nr:hypothetical protein CCUG60885_02744 [Mycobacteroides salmoniphilum]TEA05695.1 hypothetical protein CCUG60883_03001 [Mycobacteroides salmoniphilum]